MVTLTFRPSFNNRWLAKNSSLDPDIIQYLAHRPQPGPAFPHLHLDLDLDTRPARQIDPLHRITGGALLRLALGDLRSVRVERPSIKDAHEVLQTPLIHLSPPALGDQATHRADGIPDVVVERKDELRPEDGLDRGMLPQALVNW